MSDLLTTWDQVVDDGQEWLPDTSEAARRLAAQIRTAVQQETGHAIRGLTVEVTRQGVRLCGHCDSYYSKQLAQHAVMSLPCNRPLSNCIEVS